MLRISYIILLFILFSFSSNAEVDGKGFVCKCKTMTTNKNCSRAAFSEKGFINEMTYIGIYFQDGKTNLYFLNEKIINNKLLVIVDKTTNKFPYVVEPSFIYWPPKEDWDEKVWSQKYGKNITWLNMYRGYFYLNRKNLNLGRESLEYINPGIWSYVCNKNIFHNYNNFIKKMADLANLQNKKLKDLEKGNKF